LGACTMGARSEGTVTGGLADGARAEGTATGSRADVARIEGKAAGGRACCARAVLCPWRVRRQVAGRMVFVRRASGL
jgi:hypothetical protein